VVSLLALLLTWLSFRATDPDAERFDLALGTLDHFEMAETALQADVLSARSGRLRNYDSSVLEVNELYMLIARLRAIAAVDPETAAAVERLARSVVRQEHLVEQFKSDNAVLQNSLAYLMRYSIGFGAPLRTDPMVSAVNGLAAAILHLTLDTSPETVREVEDRLGDLARQARSSGDADAIKVMLAHGRVIHDLFPATDHVLRALRPVRRIHAQEDLRTLILARQSVSRTVAGEFRQLLYVVSLLLVTILGYAGLQLRARTLTLQRHAAFEHMLSDISARFINARTIAIEEYVQQALGKLAERIGADRAYFVSCGSSIQRHVWSRTGIDYPAGKWDWTTGLKGRVSRNGAGIIYVPSVDRLPAGDDKEALVAAGLHSWVCVAGPGETGGMGVLGFDALHRTIFVRREEFDLLQMARDTVTNALRRDYLQQERGRLEQRLQQSRRMETVGALASGIAHNFNNIIAAILGYAEMAEGQAVSDGRPAHNIAEIRRAGERARDLVEQILVFGRRRNDRHTLVGVRDLVREATSLLEVSLPQGIVMAVREVAESVTILGERGQLVQVILDLCSNAAQAVDRPGFIELEAETREITQMRPLSHGDLPPGRYLCIAVADAGRGMDEATLSRIFEPFFTTCATGNGLGLATVHEIVHEHGGMMNVWSRPGAGSRFEAWLPYTPPDSPASSGESLPMQPPGRGETVLVVDEEPTQSLGDEEILPGLGDEPIKPTDIDQPRRQTQTNAACSPCRGASCRSPSISVIFPAVVVVRDAA
jgi:signal transduction histidine kinase